MAVNNEEKRYYELMNSAPTAQVSAESRAAAAAMAAQENAAAQADYSTTADGKLDEAINSYLNKNGYKYSLNQDDAYREFAREHSQNALRGQELSRENAGALANGYEPTYASAVASEIAGEQAAKVGEYIPQFESLAAAENAANQQADENLVNIYNNIAGREYSRNRDAQSDRIDYLNYLANKYAAERQNDSTLDSARAEIYNTRLSGAVSDLTDARSLDTQRAQYDTVSANTRADIAEDDYEAARKLAYTKAKDAYDDRVDAEKAEAKTSANAEKTAAKEKTNAEKSARTARINAEKIKDYINDPEKMKKITAADRVDLDYNGDGKIDSSDLRLAQRTAEEEDIKSGKGVTARQSSFTNKYIRNINNLISAAGGGEPNQKLIKAQIENADALPSEQAYLYEYYNTLKKKYGWK